MVDFGSMLKKGKDFANSQKKAFENKPTADKPAAETEKTATHTKATVTDGESAVTEETHTTAETKTTTEGGETTTKSKYDFNTLIKKGKEMDKKELKNNAKDGFSIYKSFKHGGSFTSNATRAYKEVDSNRKKTAAEDKAAAEEKAAAEKAAEEKAAAGAKAAA